MYQGFGNTGTGGGMGAWSGGTAPGIIVKAKIWATDCFVSEFCDHFAEDLNAPVEVFDGWQTFGRVLDYLTDLCKKGDTFPEDISKKITEPIAKLRAAVEASESLYRKYQSYQQWKMQYYLSKMVDDISKLVNAMEKEGDVVVFPVQIPQIHEAGTAFIVEYVNRDTVRCTVVNASPFTEYHPKTVSEDNPTKIKQQVALTVSEVPISKICSEAWWSIVMLGAKSLQKEEVFYTHFLPWLTGRNHEGQIADHHHEAYYATPAKSSSTTFWKSMVHTLKYILRRAGLNNDEVKFVRHYVKQYMLKAVEEDLEKVKSIKLSTKKLIEAAAQNTAISIARNEKRFPMERLEKARGRIEELTARLKTIRCDDEGITPAPPELDITNGWDRCQQPEGFPLAECMRRLEGVDQFAGAAIEHARAVPTNFLRIPEKIETFDDALLAINECVMIITRLVAQFGMNKNHSYLVISTVTHLFLESMPVPLGPETRKKQKCIWSDTELRYGQQLHVLKRLHEISEYFMSAIFCIDPSLENDAIRITVMGTIASISDALIRVRATDKPSLFSMHLTGYKGKPPFGYTTGKYAQQTELLQFVYPEALLARARVLDYYFEVAETVPAHQVMWKWEDGIGKSDKAARVLLRQIAHSEAFPTSGNEMHLMGSAKEGNFSILTRYYPEVTYYRDIAFWFKHLMHNNFIYKNDWLSCWEAELRWEHVDGEGFNVYAFEGTQLKTEAKTRWSSYGLPSRYTSPHEVLCEDDILHIKNLTTFDDVMGQRDSELLLSYLTVPYIRIPLVLRFFATEDRISCLKNSSIQNILNAVLFEGGKFLPKDLSNVIPEEVPSEKAELIATSYGTMLNELMNSTSGVIDPIVRLVNLASELDSGTVYNETTTMVILFLVRVVARIQNYILFALDVQEKKVRFPELLRDIEVNTEVAARIRLAYGDLRDLIQTQLLPMLETWTTEAMRNVVEAQKTDEIDKATALASKLHAHAILLLRNTRPEDYDERFLSALLSSFTFLTTRYTWFTNVLPELELYWIIQRHRRHIIRFLSSQPTAVMSSVMDAVVRIVTSSGNRDGENTHKWGFVAGADCVGRFARLDEEVLAKANRDKGQAELLASLKQCLGLDALPKDSNTVFEGLQDVELNVHTLSLTFKNAHLRALPSEIANDMNVYTVFAPLVGNKEKLLETMQCAIVEDSVNRQWVRLVGQDHDIQYWKTPDQRFPIPADNMVRFYPDDLGEGEQWVYDLFEPVRLSYFERSFWDPPIFNLIQEHKLTPDNSVCVLSAVDSQSGKMLKEVYVFRDHHCVHLYDVFSYGRRFYRRLVYTTDNRYSLLQLHPSVDRRAKPWPSWGRHMAGDPDPDNSTETNTSCVILRHASHPDNISKSTETFIPGYLLYGLIPSSLIETHRFWQDADDNIRGYPVVDKDDPNKPQHMIWIHWREMKFDPVGIKNTCFQVYRFARAAETPRASEEAVLQSQKLKQRDEVAEEVEMTRQISDGHANADLEAGAFRQSSATFLAKGDAATIEDHNMLLIDLMYSREGTPLFSLARVLSRIELLSHILVWTTKTDYDSESGAPLTIDLIQLPRLKLSFAARLAPDGKTYLLYSMDHAHLFVSNLRQPLVTELLQGIPHSLILADSNHAVSIIVPALNIVRPFITTAPFSTELVINRSDALWYKKLDTRYYLYPVHVSLSFMFTPTLASALYLLLLRFYNRNYQDVFRLTSNIGTDMEFTSEESQIFNKLTYVLDSNPNAHACRAKISLMVADSPVQLGWYTPQETASMIGKFSHVNVSCRMTQSEERRLLYISDMLEKKMEIIREFAKRTQNQEGAQLVLAKIADKKSVEANMQQRKLIREFYKNLTTELREKLDVRIIREDLNRLLIMYNQHAREPLHSYYSCLLSNRRALIEAEVGAKEGEEKLKVNFRVPQLGKDLEWLFYTDFNALSAKPPGSAAKQKNDEGRIMTMSKSWDYFYCGANVRKVNTCRCRGCNENCGPGNGCPCLSCEKYNKSEGHMVRELIPVLDAQKSARTLSFFEAFMWINDSISRYSVSKLNPTYPYMEKQFPASMREPMNSFLRYYEVLTGTTKVKICSHESGRDLATLLFHFCREARNPAAGLGHMMHFVVSTPQCWNKLSKYNRNSKQKPEQRTMNLYNSILTQAASFRDPHCDVSKFPKCPISPEISLEVVPRKDTRTVETPLHMTTILPIPRNTDCNKRTLQIPDQSKLQLMGDEAKRLTVDMPLLKELADMPLKPLISDALVTRMTREEQNLPPIDEKLPFDLAQHEHASKTVARDMLSRITDDMKAFAAKENGAAIPKLVGLTKDAEVRELFSGKSTPALVGVRKQLTALQESLESLRERDLEFLNYSMPVITRTANHIEFTSDRSSALLFLRRFAHKEATMTIDFLISSLCSNSGADEWCQLNPFLKRDSCEALINLIAVSVLRANRVGHVNRACEVTKELLGLLEKADNFPELEATQLNTFKNACITSTLQKADSLAAQLLTPRVYVNPETMTFDPRFMLFEFTWNLVLRDRQREQVLEMYDSIQGNQSLVKQMIMGAGKTTVVGPLLALMLADSKNLVIQVVPPALLDFTRAVLRTTFSSVLQKLVFTFVSDRSSEVDSEILSKFEHAKQSRGIVVTTPSSIKSVFLKYVEGLDRIVDEGRERAVEMEKEAKDLLNLVKLWRNSVLIMDEVDMLLHPLKSELNFPIGAKHDIDFTPTRWKLPIHLIDAIFYFHTNRITTSMKESPDAHAILNRFRLAVRQGLKVNALQEMPHLTLLNLEYYDKELKPILAEWALLFLKSQHLTGLSDADTLRYIVRRPARKDENDFVERVSALDQDHVKMLNLTFEWLSCFMPHVMQKIDRVSFGIMNNDDMKRARDDHPNMPRSRFVTAIPFIGKDLPSQSSEFAHPDVVIGLTVLAYRYEGLRAMDFTTIMREIHAAVEKEVGRFNQRRTNIMYSKWVQASGGRIINQYSYKEKRKTGSVDQMGMQPSESAVFDEQGNVREEKIIDVLPLKLMKQANQTESDKLFKLFGRTAEVIHWYLCETIFPEFMRHQHLKLSASGQELGGNIMFDRRIGFSGTPSDLLPIELGRCGYERGTDGQLIHTLTNPEVMSFSVVNSGWSVRSLLDTIANASPPFHALIDTGALITGMSNLQVAEYLLKNGLPNMEGVVFLDEYDRKMILVRSTGRVLKLAECGIPKVKRFAFYDQVHTTGMDIEHTPNAQAVCTLGKDMTFRDFSQGAYRMRGIGNGQTVHVMVIPEVYDLINRTLHSIRKLPENLAVADRAVNAVLEDITAWLLVNSIRSEHTQHNQLCLQSCANVWRKEAFQVLSDRVDEFKIDKKPSDEAMRALSVYQERVAFEISAEVPQPRMFSENVAEYVGKHTNLITTGAGKDVVQGIMDQTKREDEVDNPVIDVQMVQEQEEEKETEQEQEKEQEIEVEKFVDLAYSRDEEQPSSWKLETLKDPARAVQFYKLSDFHLYKRRPLEFPDSILLSRNFFNHKWSGHRRMKNVIVTMEWIPDTSALKLLDKPEMDYGSYDEEAGRQQLARTLELVGSHQKELTPSLIKDLLLTALHFADSDSNEWDEVIPRILKQTGSKKYDDSVFYNELASNALRSEESGRYTVAVTLAEAETLRRVSHLRQHQKAFLPGSNVAIALNAVPSNNARLDISCGYKEPIHTYLTNRNFQCLRYFDCDLHYSDAEFGLLLRSLHTNPSKLRQAFFQQVIATRRRARQRWERTPIALLFMMSDAFRLLHQRAIGLCVRRHLEVVDLNLGDAFMAFNNSHSGILSADELWGAMKWCGLSLSVDEVLDFIDVADTAHEGTIQYPDFLCVLTGHRELEDDLGSGGAPTTDDAQGKKLPTIPPYGLEEVKAARGDRIRQQRQAEAEANKELDLENQRVMDEIENEQIAEDIRQVQESGNPFLDESSLTFTFMAESIPKLVVPYGARVRRLPPDEDDKRRALVMQSNSGLRFHTRLLKRLRQDTSASNYCLSFEFTIPRPTMGDTKKGTLSHISRMGKQLNLVHWALPMYRFSGYAANNVPHFEIEVFGVANPNVNRDEPVPVHQKKATRTRAVEREGPEITGTSVGGSGASEAVHIFKEPRPVRDPDDAIGEIKPGEFVHAEGEKTSNAIDGITYEWMKIKAPVEGWCVKEKNGRTLWEQLGTAVTFTDKGFHVDHSAIGAVGLEHVGTFEETTEEELEENEAKANEEVEDDNPVELTTDVGDLLEALRKAKRLRPGDKVTRNQDCWEKGNEDGGPGNVGKVLKVEGEKINVQWPGGNKGTYEWGNQGRFELIKVGEADSDDEGEERETMNDERWMADLRKGGQKCNHCSAQKLEPGNWFKCNHCENYNLCKKCFRGGQHTEHDFTDMGALGNMAAGGISPGAFVKIKLSVTNPKYGWESAKAGDTGVVLDVDNDENCVTIELADGSEWRGDISEVEVAKDPKEEEQEQEQKANSMGFLTAIDPNPSLPFMSGLIEAAKTAVTGKWKVGDRVKAKIDGNYYPSEIRAVLPDKEYALSVDKLGYRSNVSERMLEYCPFKVGDRVRYKRTLNSFTYGTNSIPQKDIHRVNGTIAQLKGGTSSRYIVIEVDWEEVECRTKATDLELDLVGNGKWSFTKLNEDGTSSTQALPTSSNVMTERAFQDGVENFAVFIRDDTYNIDFATNEVKKGNKAVGNLSRDPPDVFIKGEAKKQLDDGNPHLVSVLVNGSSVQVIVDGKPMSCSFTGVIQGINDKKKSQETLAAAMQLLATTPLMVLQSPVSSEMAKAHIGAMGSGFPQRIVNWIRIDWAPGGSDEIQAWHQCVDEQTAWKCRQCGHLNSRQLDACTECKNPRVAKKEKNDLSHAKFRSALPKSRESAAVRAKLQGMLRAQYQKELDILDAAASEKDDTNKRSRVGGNV